MTWNQSLAEANWIQLGYLAANVGSLLVPISKGEAIRLTDQDRELTEQQAQFFDAALAGWSSLNEPSLLFQKPEFGFSYPAGALETAAEVYSITHGGPLGDPDDFMNELGCFSKLLKEVAKGRAPSKPEKTDLQRLVVFLNAIIERAQGEMQRSARSTR